MMLASGSASRVALLRAAGVPFEAAASHVDEHPGKVRMLSESATPAEIAQGLGLPLLPILRQAGALPA